MALWDAKARHLGVPLHRLLGGSRTTVPVYGSGGFNGLVFKEADAARFRVA